MAGSSAYQFGRAAYKAGLVSRRQIAHDAWMNLVFSLRGSTDAGTDAVRERISGLLEGVRVRDLQRLAPDVLAGVLPRLYPRMLDIAYQHQDAGRPIFICTAASGDGRADGDRADLRRGRGGSVSEVVDGHYTGRACRRAVRTARARPRRSASWPSARGSTWRRRGHTRTRVRPADAARGRPSGRRASRQGAGAGRARGGLETLRFDRRRLRFAGAAVAAAAVGSGVAVTRARA